jgi:hypothetical protein
MRRRLLSGLVLFKLVVPPLQPGVVGPYRYGVYGSPAIFLEGTGHIHILGHN